MNTEKLEYINTGFFSKAFTDYLAEHPKLHSFYHLFPNKENFKKAINERVFSEEKRLELYETLQEQYKGIETSPSVNKNIDAVKQANTFTVTTGHQLNLMTGPLYFIYKILTAIKLAEELKGSYPEYNFVPVYWMATEDHDFAEINHFHLFNKKYTWEKDARGAVGRLDNSGLNDLLSQVPDLPEINKEVYLNSQSLSEATRKLVNNLFKDKGLVIIDADNKTLKKSLIPFIKEELKSNIICKHIRKASDGLTNEGYPAQAFVRDINLFYLDNKLRERIEKKDGHYEICNTDLKFSESEIMALAENSPEKFSPNVISRPMYQELILPNLAYIGGPAELSYWMQLKLAFDVSGISFPILFPRASALVINKPSLKKLDKLNLPVNDLFLDNNTLLDKHVYSKQGTIFSVNKEVEQVQKVFDDIFEKAMETDRSLEKYVLAERQKVINILSDTEKKINNAEKKKYETEVSQITGIKEKLFPNGSLQERHENYLNFFINDPAFIEKLYQAIKPFDFRFNIFLDDE